MLTPLFDVVQEDDFLTLTIKAPFSKISSTEIVIDGKEFLFVSSPYFLRLYFPNEIDENCEESAIYDCDSRSFVIKLKKKVPGEYFYGLDMITKLLTPCKKSSVKPLVEECANATDSDDQWFFEQKLPDDQCPSTSFRYGFAQMRSECFSQLREELWLLVDIPDPEQKSMPERKKIAYDQENDKFDENHYLADFFENEQIAHLLKFVCPWEHENANFGQKFTTDEKDRLKNLPKKRYPNFEASLLNVVLCSLVDILFAYSYDFRTTEGENNVESGWLISKLSSSLSCFLAFSDFQDTLVSCIRRSLCIPLYRNWELSMKIVDDVKKICKLGRNAILKCFLEIHRILNVSGDYRYIFNDLYITDYCIWLQYASDEIFEMLIETLKNMKIEKDDVKFDLKMIEFCGDLAINDENEENHVDFMENIRNHVISNRNTVDSDDENEFLEETLTKLTLN